MTKTLKADELTDRGTLAAYDRLAEDYAARFAAEAPGKLLSAFIAAVPDGGHVLDYGCGPGFDASMMQRAGLTVEAFDGSQSMVEMAVTRHGLDAQQATFAEMDHKLAERAETFDGIWANFSLLHAARSALPGHIAAIHTALVSGGAFHIALKVGEGTRTDRLSRNYTFVSVAELRDLLTGPGFMIVHVTEGREAGLAGTVDPWIAILARKTG